MKKKERKENKKNKKIKQNRFLESCFLFVFSTKTMLKPWGYWFYEVKLHDDLHIKYSML